MPSEQTEPSDALVREVARQLADAAPPAPEWSTVVGRRQRPTASERRWVPLVAVAAVTALVVSGLWLLARPAVVQEEPADLPVTVPAPQPPGTYPEWLLETDRVNVQLCHSRAAARIIDDTGYLAFSQRVGDPDYTGERARHTAFRAPVTVWQGVREHPDGADAGTDALVPVIEAWQSANEGYYGEQSGLPSPTFAADVEVLEGEIGRYVRSSADPTACWFDRTEVSEMLATDIDGVDGMVACLLSAQLAAAVGDFTTTEPADAAFVDFVQSAWVEFAHAAPTGVGEIATALDDLRFAAPEEIASLRSRVLDLLGPSWSAPDADCAEAVSTPVEEP